MKKLSKIILVIAILLIISLIVVGVWYLVSGLDKSNDRIGELENKIESMVDNENESTRNNNLISNDINNTVKNDNNTSENTTKSDNTSSLNILKESEALKLGKEKYNEAVAIVPECNYNTRILKEEVSIEGFETVGAGYWEKLENIEQIKSILTEEAFHYFCEEYVVRKIDGIYYKYESDRGETPEYEVSKVLNISESKVEYELKWKDSDSKLGIKKLILIKENETWKISEYAF